MQPLLGSQQLCGIREVVVSSFSVIGPSGPVANSQVVGSSPEACQQSKLFF